MAVEEGKKAPAFTLADEAGEKRALKDYAGKNVVLYFYPRDDTPGCAEDHQKFIAKYKLPFSLLSDPDKKVMTKYGAWGEKMMYGKKTTGVIRSTVWIGADGKVVKHWKRVANAEKHPEKVLQALEEKA